MVNGKVYVGSAVNPKQRWIRHISNLRSGTHHSTKLQRSFNKYGESVFRVSILENVDDKTCLIHREQYYISLLRSYTTGYNASPTAGSNLGTHRSHQHRLLMRRITKDNPKAFKKGHVTWNKGKSWSVDSRRKMSLAKKGKKQDPEVIQKRALKIRGQKRTVEQRQKLSEAQRGSKNHNWNQPAWNRGKLWSTEIRRKMSQTHSDGLCKCHRKVK